MSLSSPLIWLGLGAIACWVSGAAAAGDAAPNSAEAQQFYDRLLTPPTPGGAQEGLYGAFIDGLVADGVWDKLDHLTLFFAGDSEGDALTNLVSGKYNAARAQSSGRLTFSLKQHYSGGGAYRVITTNFNPATAASAKFRRDDAMFGVWIASPDQVNQAAFADGHAVAGAWTNKGKVGLFPKWSSGNCIWNINGSSRTFPAPENGSGFFLVQRTGPASAALYHNNTLLDTDSSASTGLCDEFLYSPCQHAIRALVIGGALSEAQRTSLYNRLAALVTAITGGLP